MTNQQKQPDQQANQRQTAKPANASQSKASPKPSFALRDAESVDVFEYEPAGFMSRGRW